MLLFLFSCEKETETPAETQVTFKSFGLDNRIVNELRLNHDRLYAATDNGLYVKDLKGSADWQLLGLQGNNIKTMAILPDGLLLAAGSDPARTTFKIYKREANATAFVEVNNNFGGTEPEPLNNFFYKEDSQELLAVGSTVIARSADNGQTWTPLYGEWHGVASGLDFVQVNPRNQDIWAGGQNAIEGFALFRYSPSTETWQNWINLLPSPSVAKDIAFDKLNPGTVIVGGEDGIIKTTDNGSTWSVIKDDHQTARFYFGLEFDAADNKKIYAASWLKNFEDPQPLILAISKDAGLSWEEYTYQKPNLFGGVLDMVQVKEGLVTKLYLGLHKGGVYEATIR